MHFETIYVAYLCYVLALVYWGFVTLNDAEITDLREWARRYNPMDQNYLRMSVDLETEVRRARKCAFVLFFVGTLIHAYEQWDAFAYDLWVS